MGKITIERSQELRDSMRNYNIVLDGKYIGKIGYGEIKEFDVPNGNHTLIAKIDWCTSNVIRFKVDNEKDDLKFEIAAFRKSNLLTIIIGIAAVLMVMLHRTAYQHYILFFGIPVFLIIAYYITIGRKKYLTFTEI